MKTRSFVSFVSFVSFASFGCGGSQPTAAPGEGFRTLTADQVMVGFEQYMTKAGRNSAIIRGDTAYIFEDSALIKVKHAKLTLYDEQGREAARLTSKTGDLNSMTRGMIARGNVVLITQGAGTIETEELHYDPNTHRVWSNVPTVQRQNGGILRGSGFEADDKFNNVRVSNARSSGGGFKINF